MRPSNMHIDLATLQITAILELEFTNTMPANFTYDPPWWLLLTRPDLWLERDAMEEFVALYEAPSPTTRVRKLIPSRTYSSTFRVWKVLIF